MKNIKRAAAAALAALMLAAGSGCGDQSWSYRSGDVSLTAGTYIYNLLTSYYEAEDKVESADEVKKILEAEVEDSDGNKKTVEQYSLDGADAMTLRMIAVEKLFKDYGLELAESDYKTVMTYSDQMWGNIKDRFTGYGISQDSFNYCYAEYGVKHGQVFEYLYGKNGEKYTTDEEMIKYFNDNYTGYAYFALSMAETDEEGNSVAKSEEEFKKADSSFAEYVDMINKDGKTYKDTVLQYTKDYELTTDPTSSGAVKLDDNRLTPEISEALAKLDEGKATFIKTGEDATTMYYFVYRPTNESIIDFKEPAEDDTDSTASVQINDTAATADTPTAGTYIYDLKSGYTHYSLLNEMKKDEYEDYLLEYAKGLSVEKNDTILKKFKPNMFKKDKS
ncbi:MAG: hypothetical protein VZR27_02800 [Acutalibacteraceae bacterium]|nr:hypothetical protein [Clostridia bacterium]MEE3449617.1 hypothetical protein [Acutalibacteraceae bacterium]